MASTGSSQRPRRFALLWLREDPIEGDTGSRRRGLASRCRLLTKMTAGLYVGFCGVRYYALSDLDFLVLVFRYAFG